MIDYFSAGILDILLFLWPIVLAYFISRPAEKNLNWHRQNRDYFDSGSQTARDRIKRIDLIQLAIIIVGWLISGYIGTHLHRIAKFL